MSSSTKNLMGESGREIAIKRYSIMTCLPLLVDYVACIIHKLKKSEFSMQKFVM